MSNGNGRQLTRAQPRQMAAPPQPQQQSWGPPSPAQQGWFWDGSQWVCAPDCDDPCTPCPPFPPVPGFRPFFDPISNPWYPGANAGVSFGTTPPKFPIRGNFWWDGIRLWMFDGAAWVDIVESAIIGGSGGGGTVPGSGMVFVGTSPPPNPAIGQQWWNGSIMQLWTGTAWVITGSPAPIGPVTTTTQVFAVGNPFDTSPIGTTELNWSIAPISAVPNIDPMAGWNAATHHFRPLKAGFYQFEIRSWSGAGGGGIVLVKNDTGTYNNDVSDITVCLDSDESGSNNLMATGMVLLNGSTDFVRLFAWDTTGLFHNTGSTPCMQGWLFP